MNHAPKMKQERGFTLIEILVAMLVLAIGLLGVAAMQLRGLQYNHDAYLRSQASVLASGIADRMRLNVANAGDYTGSFTIPASAPTGCSQTASNATNDLACWRYEAWRSLPVGSVTSITVATDRYTVSLQPFDRSINALGTAITYTFVL